MSNPPPAPPRKSLLRRALVVVAVLVGVSALVLGIGGFALYRAATTTPPEYAALLDELDELQASGELDQHRQALESQVAALYSEAQSEPRWRSVVTEDQLNGWLTMQLPIDFPELEKQGVLQPRVRLKEDTVTLACRARVQGSEAVVSVTLAPLVTDDGWVGAELRRVTVGQLPLPVGRLTDLVDQLLDAPAVEREGVRYRWSENEGNPALLFAVEQLASTAEQARRLDTLLVREGELLISGVTEDRPPPSGADSPAAATPPSLPPPAE